MKIKNIFFDFDGVIAESVGVKTEAFRELYLPYGNVITEKVVKHHIENGGMSRFEKFKYYHNEFLSLEIDELEIQNLANQFSKLVMQGVINSPEVTGAHDFLKNNYKKYKCFVITGTPTNEALKIIKARGLTKYFLGVFGSPQKKDYWCEYILNKNNLETSETIFIGDALADYMAAKKFDITFFLRECEENIGIFKNVKVDVKFNDFKNFNKLLNQIV